MGENAANLHAFDVDLGKFAKKIGLAPKIVVTKITLDLFAKIVKRTPVDTGRARSSWDVKETDASDYVPPEGTTGTKDVSGAIAAIDGTKIVFITSNIDYMQYLEKGSSKQAPAGIVLLSIAEMEVEIESIIDQL